MGEACLTFLPGHFCLKPCLRSVSPTERSCGHFPPLRQADMSPKGKMCLKLFIPGSLAPSPVRVRHRSGHLGRGVCFTHVRADGPFGYRPFQCPWKSLSCWTGSWLLQELVHAASVKRAPEVPPTSQRFRAQAEPRKVINGATMLIQAASR